MLKCSKEDGTSEFEEALATVLDIIKSVNDSMHQISITGFEVNSLRWRRIDLHTIKDKHLNTVLSSFLLFNTY